MAPTTTGFVVLALSVILSRRLGLDFGRSPRIAFAALVGFSMSLILEGLSFAANDPGWAVIGHWCSAVGWFLLVIALVRVSGALDPKDDGETDVEVEEYLAFREEKQRTRMRQRLEEKED